MEARGMKRKRTGAKKSSGAPSKPAPSPKKASSGPPGNTGKATNNAKKKDVTKDSGASGSKDDASKKKKKKTSGTAAAGKDGENKATAVSIVSSPATSPAKKRLKKEADAAPAPKKAPPAPVSISSNWKALQQTMPKKKKRPQTEDKEEADQTLQHGKGRRHKPLKPLPPPIKDDKSLTKVIALDCEMVGVGINGRESMLARVCIINSFGNNIYDKFVRPQEKVVDYRTWVSGVTKEDMNGPNALPFATIQKEVAEIIKDKIVVGHGLENDFKALLLRHPFSHTRDTAKYRPLQKSKGRPRRLQYLARKILGVQIQDKGKGAHDPTEDARAALMIYKNLKRDWEEYILKKQKRYMRRRKKVERAKKRKAAKEAKRQAKADEAAKQEEEMDFDQLLAFDYEDDSSEGNSPVRYMGFDDGDDDDDYSS